MALTIYFVELTAAARSSGIHVPGFRSLHCGHVIYIIVNQIVVNLMRWLGAAVRASFIGRRSPRSPLGWRSDFNVIERSFGYSSGGTTFTLTLTGLAALGGIIFGTILAMMRLSSFKWLQLPATGYVNLMRSIPLLLVIFWFYFLVPYIGAWIVGSPTPIRVGAFASSVITFTLFEAAYYSRSCARASSRFRAAGVGGLCARAQLLAVDALYRIAAGVPRMLPILLTQTIILFQDTSLVYVLSITDFLGAASKVAQRDGRLVEMYLFAAVVYFMMSFSLSYIVKRLQRKIAIIR